MHVLFWIITAVVLFATLTLVGFHPLIALIVAGIAAVFGSQVRRARVEFRRGIDS